MAIEKSEIQLFEDKRIRTAWDESREEFICEVDPLILLRTSTLTYYTIAIRRKQP